MLLSILTGVTTVLCSHGKDRPNFQSSERVGEDDGKHDDEDDHEAYKQSSELMVQAAVFLAFFTCRLSAKRDLPSEQHQHATLVT